MYTVGLAMQTTHTKPYLFDWRASYDRNLREIAISNEPVFFISFYDDGDEENLDSEEGGGGAQNSEFDDKITMTVYSRTPLDFPNGNPVDNPILNSETPYNSEAIAYDGLQDIKQAFDINGTEGNIICNAGVYDLQYKTSQKVPIDTENNYNTIEMKTIFELKYRTPRRRV